MSWKRSFAIVLICGFFSVLVDAALDGNWPNYSPWGWLGLPRLWLTLGVGGSQAASAAE